MSKRKEPADAFGLSLLDVLSNALGGVILLTLIVAATIKGNDKLRLNLPPDLERGNDYTDLDFDVKKKKKIEFDLLIIQMELIGGTSELKLFGEDLSHCSISKRTISDDQLNVSDEWLIVRQNKMDSNWSIEFSDTENLPDSIAVIITLDNLTPFGEKVEISGTKILNINESLTSKPNITIFEKPIPL